MSQLILGLGNKARHGKDSFAQAIDDYFARFYATSVKHGLMNKPVIVQRHAFADALYREVNNWLKDPQGQQFLEGHQALVDTEFLPHWVVPDPKAEVNARAPLGKHPKLLQWWGTEYRRAQDSNYWVKKWKEGINPNAQIVLSTDMRFINEAEAVKSVGGYTVRVSRLNADGTLFIDSARPADHPSETQLDGYNVDYQITVKTGDLVLLEEWAVTLVHFLRARAKKK